LNLFTETLIFAENKRYFLRDACGGEAILFYNEKLMKYLLTLFALFTIFIYGCGDDNTTNTNNNGNGETVIFSLDSLSINLNSSIQVNDTLFYLTDASTIKITFNCETNADSVNGFALYRIVAGDSNGVFKDTSSSNISTLNSQHVINIIASNYYALSILIQLSRNNSFPYFIRLKNIKVFRV